MSYVQLNTMFDAAFPYGGVQRYWKSSFLKELGDDVLDILVDRAATMPSPMSMVGFFHVHGAATRVDPDATAFGLRDDQWDYDVISQWDRSRGVRPSYPVDPRVLDGGGAVRDRAKSMSITSTPRKPHGSGPPTASNYERLVALKNKYDPTNLFRLNQNIKPTV